MFIFLSFLSPPLLFFFVFLYISRFLQKRTGDYALESARWLCLLHLRLDRSERGSSRKERWQQKFNNKSIKTLGVEGWERRKINVVMNRKSINNLFIPWHTRKKENPFREFRHPIFKRFRQVWRMCWKKKKTEPIINIIQHGGLSHREAGKERRRERERKCRWRRTSAGRNERSNKRLETREKYNALDLTYLYS